MREVIKWPRGPNMTIRELEQLRAASDRCAQVESNAAAGDVCWISRVYDRLWNPSLPANVGDWHSDLRTIARAVPALLDLAEAGERLREENERLEQDSEDFRACQESHARLTARIAELELERNDLGQQLADFMQKHDAACWAGKEAVAAEREACAYIASEWETDCGKCDGCTCQRDGIAAAIRARATQPRKEG